MYRYFLGNGEELDSKEEALTCPDCGEQEDVDYNIEHWQSDGENRITFREYSCLCNACKILFDFQETKFWD